MNEAWVCFAIVVGFYVTTIAAFVTELFGKRCPHCRKCLSKTASIIVEDAINPKEDQD